MSQYAYDVCVVLCLTKRCILQLCMHFTNLASNVTGTIYFIRSIGTRLGSFRFNFDHLDPPVRTYLLNIAASKLSDTHQKKVSKIVCGLSKMNMKWNETDDNFRTSVYNSIVNVFGCDVPEPVDDCRAICCLLFGLGASNVKWKELPNTVQTALICGIKRCVKFDGVCIVDALSGFALMGTEWEDIPLVKMESAIDMYEIEIAGRLDKLTAAREQKMPFITYKMTVMQIKLSEATKKQLINYNFVFCFSKII